MSPLSLGLIAALAWGLHDICVRVVSPGTSIYAALLTVLGFGAVFQSLAMTVWGGFGAIPGDAVWLAILAGGFFTLASIALYKAFAVGPVRLVSPIVAAYPVVSVGLAALKGTPVSASQMLAIAAVIAGVSLVATLSDRSDDPAQRAGRKSTIMWSLLAGFGYALTFSIGHTASEHAPDLPVILITRVSAIALLLFIMLALHAPFLPRKSQLPVLAVMGLLDAVALVCVLSASGLPNAVFAPVAAAMFGMVTILIAWAFLHEKMHRLQWSGVILAFAGIGYLTL